MGEADARVAAWWAAFWAAPHSRRLGAEQRVLVGRYAACLQDWLRWSETLRQYPLVEGSQGQPRPNPLGTLLAERVSEMEQLARQIGLGLENLARLAIPAEEPPSIVDELRARRERRRA